MTLDISESENVQLSFRLAIVEKISEPEWGRSEKRGQQFVVYSTEEQLEDWLYDNCDGEAVRDGNGLIYKLKKYYRYDAYSLITHVVRPKLVVLANPPKWKECDYER